MEELFNSVLQLFFAAWELLVNLGAVALPWWPLAAWILFWLFAVNWVKLRQALVDGAWVGVVLIGLVMILVWGTVAPPAGDYHIILGLKLSNYVGKTVYVAALFTIMFLCGSVQLSGCCSPWTPVELEKSPAQPPGSEPAH